MNVRRGSNRRRTLALAAALLVTAGGCRAIGPAPTSVVATSTMMRSEVYFGLSRPDGSTVTAEAFRAFVDDEVAPRFPDGFTILAAEGHWRGADGDVVTEPSRVLVLLTSTPEQSRAIDAIARAYRERFGQEAVLRATSPARVTFVTAPATRPAR